MSKVVGQAAPNFIGRMPILVIAIFYAEFEPFSSSYRL
jgi:hypothetical protein